MCSMNSDQADGDTVTMPAPWSFVSRTMTAAPPATSTQLFCPVLYVDLCQFK